MIFRWGHFADLHFVYGDSTYNTIRQDLIRALTNLCRENPLHAIFVAGDLFNQGNINRADSCEPDNNVIERVVAQLYEMADACRCEYENIIVTPGNHDIPRSNTRKILLKSIIQQYLQTKQPATPVINLSDEDAYVIYDAVSKPFETFCQKLYDGTGREVSLPHGIYELTHDGVHWANVITLNTATFDAFSSSEKPEIFGSAPPSLYIADRKFQDFQQACGDIQSAPAINIILAHHSVEFFAPEEADILRGFMEGAGIDLYLCGHVHRHSFHTFNSIYDTRQLACGGIFKDRKENYNRPSFYIGQYDSDTCEITIHAYAYSPEVTSNKWDIATGFPSPWMRGVFSRRLPRLDRLSAKISPPGNFSIKILPSANHYQMLLHKIDKENSDGYGCHELCTYRFVKAVHNVILPILENNRDACSELEGILRNDLIMSDGKATGFYSDETKRVDFIAYYSLALFYKHSEQIMDGSSNTLGRLISNYGVLFSADEFPLSLEVLAWHCRYTNQYVLAYQYDKKLVKMLPLEVNAGVYVSLASSIAKMLQLDEVTRSQSWGAPQQQYDEWKAAVDNVSAAIGCYRTTWSCGDDDPDYPKHRYVIAELLYWAVKLDWEPLSIGFKTPTQRKAVVEKARTVYTAAKTCARRKNPNCEIGKYDRRIEDCNALLRGM